MAYSEKSAEEVLTSYDHRDDANGEFEAEGILRNILDQYDANYSMMESDDYSNVMVWNEDTPGEFIIRANFTYPVNSGVDTDVVLSGGEEKDMAGSINDFIPEAKVIDAASAKMDVSDPMNVKLQFRDETFETSSAHCLTFRDTPPFSRDGLKDDFEDETHLRSALEAISEPSLGTLLVFSGDIEGERVAAANIDYWHRTYDALNGGIDYTSWDWHDPEF